MNKFVGLMVCICLPLLVHAAGDCGVPKRMPHFEGLIDAASVKPGDGSVIAGLAAKRVALVLSPEDDLVALGQGRYDYALALDWKSMALFFELAWGKGGDDRGLMLRGLALTLKQ